MSSERISRTLPHSGRPGGRRPFLLAGVVLAGCGGPQGPRWIDLTEGFRPAAFADVAGVLGVEVALRGDPAEDSLWLEHFYTREDWRAEGGGVFSTERPLGGAFDLVPDGRFSLGDGERTFLRLEGDVPEPGAFRVTDERVFLALDPEDLPPELVTFGVHVPYGVIRDGRWRVQAGELSASGIPVWSGTSEAVTDVDVPEASTLSFTTRWLGRGHAEEVRFHVKRDGETILEVGAAESGPHVLELRAGSPAHFEFRVSGAPGLGLFLNPLVRPAEIGDYTRRPWGDDRPDVVLFIADTLRADALASSGGDSDLAPRLNELAARSVCFTQARASSSWTLPSISSLLTGLHPGQHTATEETSVLPAGLETLAEGFCAAGYRTSAVTDSAFFSHGHGLDQGFERFVEHPHPDWDLTRTIDEALAQLASDDGRPVFLVVHTYRVHAPYRVGPDEDSSAFDALQEEGTRTLGAVERRPGIRIEAMLQYSDRLRALYEAGIADLNDEVGRFVAGLDRLGFLETGYLAFTSDHGEAFGENEQLMHGKDLYDTKLRVPLLLCGGDLAPGEVSAPVSLVDLAPTLRALTGIGSPERSIVGAGGDRTSYAFLLEEKRRQGALVQGARKVFFDPDEGEPTPLRAFDLAGDPEEERDVAGAGWPGELLERYRLRRDELLAPRADSREVRPGSAPDLRGIGYGGE